MRSHAIMMLAGVLTACCSRAPVSAADIPATQPTTAPVAAVWFEQPHARPAAAGDRREPRRLIVGVWANGTVIWSDNRATGGAPYYIGRIPDATIAKLLASLDEVGLFDVSRDVWFGPDASYTVIAAEADGKRKWLGSWHDPPTTRPLRLIDQRGISSLAPAEPRPKPSPEYARFLEVWAESRRLIESVVPEREGRPLNAIPNDAIFKTGRAAQ